MPARTAGALYEGTRALTLGTLAMLAARLSFYYVVHFFAIGVSLPFWSLWLHSRGVGAETIGFLSSLGSIVSMVSSPMAGRAAERLGSERLPMTFLACVAIGGFALFPFVPAHVVPLGLVSVATWSALGALLPLAESITLRSASGGSVHYGRVRLWGSLAFMVASIGVGACVETTGIAIVPHLMLGAAIGCLIASQLMPRSERANLVVGEISAAAPAEPVRWPVVVAGIAIANTIQCSHALFYSFGSLDWQARGIPAETIGILFSVGVIAEIALLAASPLFVSRLSPSALLMIGASAAALRWIGLAHASDPNTILGVQMLHALSYGATHLGGMEWVRRSLPASRLATAQGLYTAAQGIAFGISTAIAGVLFEQLRSNAYYGSLTIAVLGLAGAGALNLMQRPAAIAPAILRVR